MEVVGEKQGVSKIPLWNNETLGTLSRPDDAFDHVNEAVGETCPWKETNGWTSPWIPVKSALDSAAISLSLVHTPIVKVFLIFPLFEAASADLIGTFLHCRSMPG